MSNKRKRKKQKKDAAPVSPEILANKIESVLDHIEAYVQAEDDGYYLMLSREEAEILFRFIQDMAGNTNAISGYAKELEQQVMSLQAKLLEKQKIWTPNG